MSLEVMLRDFIKLSGCNPLDRTHALACNRIFMPEEMARCDNLCFVSQISLHWVLFQTANAMYVHMYVSVQSTLQSKRSLILIWYGLRDHS